MRADRDHSIRVNASRGFELIDHTAHTENEKTNSLAKMTVDQATARPWVIDLEMSAEGSAGVFGGCVHRISRATVG